MHNAIHGPVTTLISDYFMTKTSEQQVADLVSDLDGAVLDTKNRVIEVEIVELTDEKIETFLLLFGHEEYFTFRDVIGLPSTGHFPDDYTRPTN